MASPLGTSDVPLVFRIVAWLYQAKVCTSVYECRSSALVDNDNNVGLPIPKVFHVARKREQFTACFKKSSDNINMCFARVSCWLDNHLYFPVEVEKNNMGRVGCTIAVLV